MNLFQTPDVSIFLKDPANCRFGSRYLTACFLFGFLIMFKLNPSCSFFHTEPKQSFQSLVKSMGRDSNMSIYNRSGTDLFGTYTRRDGGPSPPPRPPATRCMTIIMHSAGRVPKKVGDGDGKGDGDGGGSNWTKRCSGDGDGGGSKWTKHCNGDGDEGGSKWGKRCNGDGDRGDSKWTKLWNGDGDGGRSKWTI